MSLRRVKVLSYTSVSDFTKREVYTGYFHQWVVVNEQDGCGGYRRVVVAIVEDAKGEITFVEPHLLRFDEAPA